ncbi:MAG: sigma-54-dependent Fis family transcriptional regulator [Candidatus Schekmanbacteria bacterium]|nr:MAG: sigma-54-dependent Fis family transcriptional regulator [Candidatus Schekmanbacteria bacterium]
MPEKKISVFLITENLSTINELTPCFDASRFELLCCNDSSRAKTLIDQNHYDIVFTFLNMKGCSGIELLDYIKSNSPFTDVIILSSEATISSATEALKKGAQDFLQYPLDLSYFKSYLSKLVQQHKLLDENKRLKELLKIDSQNDEIVGTSPKIKMVYKLIDEIAPTDVTVLLEGESGTGKELVARAIHRRSHRNNMPFVALNCGALPENLIESELFGHEKGAFTGAVQRKKGRIEQANKGTLFLDEIAELSLTNQVDLLRVLEEQKVSRVGGLEKIAVDVRFIAATNKNLEELCKRGEFREDLFYRLNVIRMTLPPLRQRKEDIPQLAEAFLHKFVVKYDKEIKSISPEAIEALKEYSFPGNVRELKNIIERAVVLSKSDEIKLEDLPEQISEGRMTRGVEDTRNVRKFLSLKEREKQAIFEAVQLTNGNRKKAANLLGISLRTLQYKLKKYNLAI